MCVCERESQGESVGTDRSMQSAQVGLNQIELESLNQLESVCVSECERSSESV